MNGHGGKVERSGVNTDGGEEGWVYEVVVGVWRGRSGWSFDGSVDGVVGAVVAVVVAVVIVVVVVVVVIIVVVVVVVFVVLAIVDVVIVVNEVNVRVTAVVF